MFNTNFKSGKIPPFPGGFRTRRATILSHDIEDVEYEDVSDTPKSQEPSYDRKARAHQILDAALKSMKKLSIDDPFVSLMFLQWFKEGATFYDSHPQSSYRSETEWAAAMQEFHESKVSEYKNKAKQDLSMYLWTLMLLSHLEGVLWAEENPPKK